VGTGKVFVALGAESRIVALMNEERDKREKRLDALDNYFDYRFKLRVMGLVGLSIYIVVKIIIWWFKRA
jgi:hypothetical protein